MAIAYEIRNANIILLLAEIIVLIIYDKKILNKFLNFITFGVGLLIILTPQFILNKSFLGVNSFLIKTANYVGNKSLFLHQIAYGLEVNRREIELVSGNMSVGRIFENPVATELIAKYGEVNTWGDYIKLIIKEPLNIISFYVTKLLLIFDLRFQNIVSAEFKGLSGSIFTICNITLWIVGFLSGILKSLKNSVISLKASEKCISCIMIILILLPSIAQCVGGFEGRFATSIYVIYFAYLVYLVDWEKFMSKLKRNSFCCIGLALVIFMILLATWGMAYTSPNRGNSLIF